MAGLVARAIAASRLNTEIYEEVAKDPAATSQAWVVIAAAAVAEGITTSLLSNVLFGIVTAFFQFVLLVLAIAATYVVGTRIVREPQRFKGIYVSDAEPAPAEQATFGEFFRSTGIAMAPAVLVVLRAVPYVGGLLWGLVAIWLLWSVAGAVQQALNYSSFWRAWIVWFVSGVFSFIVCFVPLTVCLVAIKLLVG